VNTKRNFIRISVAGITFQAGSAVVDSTTIMSALMFQLTGSSILVGAVTAILRFGWLFPQIIVGFFAQRSGSSMKYYVIGAFGRAAFMALMALILYFNASFSPTMLAIAVMLVWAGYSFVSGVVGVPYNDIVARSVPSELRSRLLATRFFIGGILALIVVGLVDQFIKNLIFPLSYAAIFLIASALMFLSSVVFTSMGEPPAAAQKPKKSSFFTYLKQGRAVFKTDRKFRLFVYAQWCGGAVLMALPFYIVQASLSGFDFAQIALLLAAQTVGALVSNLAWGWLGDHKGKGVLLRVITLGRMIPAAVLILIMATGYANANLLYVFVAVFFMLGALANGQTIANIGFLMEISPNDQRPAYSGYFGALTAPAFVLPFLAGVLASFTGLLPIFILSVLAGMVQVMLVRRIEREMAK